MSRRLGRMVLMVRSAERITVLRDMMTLDSDMASQLWVYSECSRRLSSQPRVDPVLRVRGRRGEVTHSYPYQCQQRNYVRVLWRRKVMASSVDLSSRYVNCSGWWAVRRWWMYWWVSQNISSAQRWVLWAWNQWGCWGFFVLVSLVFLCFCCFWFSKRGS